MSQRIPRSLFDQLSDSCTKASELVAGAELARANAQNTTSTRAWLHPRRLESLYELAFLRIYTSWEDFLEQTFLRYLCGYTCPGRTVVRTGNQPMIRTIADARNALYGGRRYILWHDPAKHLIQRSQKLLLSGCPHEDIARSSLSVLQGLASIRHRIAHLTTDSRTQFDNTTMGICGKRYPGGRPGRFLRDQDSSSPVPKRFFETTRQQLVGLAGQICP